MLNVTNPSPDQPLKQTIDSELDAFQSWFQEHLKNGEPLVRSERAILATYLAWKLKEKPNGAPNPG